MTVYSLQQPYSCPHQQADLPPVCGGQQESGESHQGGQEGDGGGAGQEAPQPGAPETEIHL